MNEDENIKRDEFEEVKKTVNEHERIIRHYLKAFFIMAGLLIAKFFIWIYDCLKVMFKFIFT